ncbi:MAG: hypothetical protein ACK40K_08820, partial [Raineya sp.]
MSGAEMNLATLNVKQLQKFKNNFFSQNIAFMQEDCTQFVEFGKIFDRPTRAYFAEYLKKKVGLENKLHLLPTALQVSHQPIAKAIDKIFEN